MDDSAAALRRTGLTVATVLGLGHATFSLIWLAGSTVLLDTVGGDIEDWAHRGGWAVKLALVAVILAKLVAVALGIACARTRSRPVRVLTYVAAVILVVYGGVNTLTTQLIRVGAIDRSADVTRRAVEWHAWLWDPWFLLWGLALAAVLVTTTRRRASAGCRTGSAPRAGSA